MYMYIDKKKININNVNLFKEPSLVGTSQRASWSLSYRMEWPWSLRGAIPPGDSASCWVNSCLSHHRYHINPNTSSHCYLISDNHCIASSMELHCLHTGKTLAPSNQLNVLHFLYCVITEKTNCLNWYHVNIDFLQVLSSHKYYIVFVYSEILLQLNHIYYID